MIEIPVLLIAKGFSFAAQQHVHQKRKGENQEPYINHVAEVAHILAEATGGEDPGLVLAGLLHDTVEDTETSYSDLVSEFGKDVADLVMEVTDDKSLTKAVRKQKQIDGAPHKSSRAKMLKMADKISNLRSMVQSPPADWSAQRKRAYFDWAKAVIDGCRGVHPGLERQFDEAYRGIDRV